jgi:type I restriction enzyme, R subunit
MSEKNKKIGTYSTKPTESDMRIHKIDPAIFESWPRELIDTEHQIKLDKGEIIIDPETGKHERLPKQLKPDYTLRFNDEHIAAFVEAKNYDKKYDHGIKQAINYSRSMDVKFAYATNGREINPQNNYGIREFDFIKFDKGDSDSYNTRGVFPTPEELKERLYAGGFGDELEFFLEPHKIPLNKFGLRYYQQAAVDAAIESIIKGKKRILLNLATGTGKTKIAYHITRKLWEHYLDPNENHPKFLFLTDRNQLVNQAMKGDFSPFKGKMTRLQGKKTTAFDVYFTLYQSLDSNKEDSEETQDEYELYKQYDKNFFKYIIIDECHRGAQSEGGKWREILQYFDSAVHIGMTATPKVDADSVETFEYFDHVAYVYSEKQGVNDGFLAPHFLKRITLSHDVDGWRREYEGQLGRNGQPLEDRLYEQDDYDGKITVIGRQRKVAKEILKFLNTKPNSKYDKTIVFCRDQQHANEMTQMIQSQSKEKNLDYCVQITSDQGEEGKKQLANFCDVKEKFPVIAVTSKLMTTGVDAQMCKVIVLDTNVNSKTELKQIIGRGTRVYDESTEMDKHYFTIIDFRKSTKKLEDLDWDSPPLAEVAKPKSDKPENPRDPFFRPEVEGDEGSVVREVTKRYDTNAKTGYNYTKIEELIGNAVRSLSGPMIDDFKNLWLDLDKRSKLVSEFESKGISLDNIREIENLTQDKYDLFDVFVKIVYDEKPKLRKLRAEQAKKDKTFFEKYPAKAQDVLNILLDHYAEYGYKQLEDRKVLQLNKFEKLGGFRTILTQIFESPEKFDDALKELLVRVYK